MQQLLFEHRVRRAAQPVLVVAAVVVALSDQGGLGGRVVFAAAAAAAIVAMGCELRHKWDSCPSCSAPPTQLGSAEARQRLAGAVHGPALQLVRALAVTVQLAALALAGHTHIVAVRVVAAGAVAAAWLWLYRDVRRVVWHSRARDECPLPRCRTARYRPFAVAFRHYRPWGAMAFGVQAIVDGTCGADAAFDLSLIGFIVLSRAGAPGGQRHRVDELCPHCRIPRDPALAVARWRAVMRACHTRWWVGMSLAASTIALIAIVLDEHAPGPRLVACVYIGTRAVVLAAEALVHAPLIPWCPWCRSGGEGGWLVDVSDPDPSRSNPLPTTIGEK